MAAKPWSGVELAQVDRQRAEIVRFWRTVELFSPQKVDKPGANGVSVVRPGLPLPWGPDHPNAEERLGSDLSRRYVVYLGIYRLTEVFDVLSRVFTPNDDSFDERPNGESAVAAFMVDEHGHLLADSAVLSSCAWAVGHAVKRAGSRRGWLSGFAEASTKFGEALTDLATVGSSLEGDARPRRLTGAHLDQCLAAAVDAARIDSLLTCGEIRISSHVVARRTAHRVGHDFLNSHIMDDLHRVADRAEAGDLGAALCQYLRPAAELATAKRTDVRVELWDLLDRTAPDVVPAGRWPGRPDHALALNQQLAVCTATQLTGSGVLGVNGPPGTGKTTMLRDLIAALVVERARRLMALAEPGAAFTGQKSRWTTGLRTRVVSSWRSQLTGFEMVVASANNGAVQNVTDEIPAADAIDGSWREPAAEVGYFPTIGTALLAPDEDTVKGPAVGHDAWALVAARLGRKSNRSRFVTNFWYHTPNEPEDDNPWFGMLSILKGYEQDAEKAERPSWADAVAEFRAVDRRERTVRARRAAVHAAVVRRRGMAAELADSRRAVASATGRVDRARERYYTTVRVERERQDEAARTAEAYRAEVERRAEQRRAEAERLAGERRAGAERAADSWEAELGRRWQTHAGHRAARPGLWQQLRTFGAAGRQWAQQDRWLAEQVATARTELTAAQQAVAGAGHVPDVAAEPAGPPPPYEPLRIARRELDLAQHEVARAGRAQEDAENALRKGEALLGDLDRRLDEAAKDLGPHLPDESWWEDRERRESVAPWTDAEWNTVRSELFLAALRLHKEFLRHNATVMRQNLQAAMDVVSGDAPGDAPEDAVLAAWQSLFFVVPVVSTTFASYARLFGHLGKEALGWVLIDEAGQATPQQAVGALWRSKRAVVLGDPLQLEPVTTLPFRTEQAIRNEFRVDEQWLTTGTSVQRIADRLTSLGTWLPGDDDPIWVGVPLSVHRRCDRPMFGIINAIAYGGLMIDGTARGPAERFDLTYPSLPRSKWIDVAGGGSQGHWVHDEGVQLDRVLRALAELRFDFSEVMVIAPFRDIATEVRRRRRRYSGLVAGTIHTAQGKQADIVVLVLGSDPGKPGARRWAAERPNLLNVAVSRAKRRLYVIGNRRLWSPERHFEILAAELPHSPALP